MPLVQYADSQLNIKLSPFTRTKPSYLVFFLNNPLIKIKSLYSLSEDRPE